PPVRRARRPASPPRPRSPRLQRRPQAALARDEEGAGGHHALSLLEAGADLDAAAAARAERHLLRAQVAAAEVEEHEAALAGPEHGALGDAEPRLAAAAQQHVGVHV